MIPRTATRAILALLTLLPAIVTAQAPCAYSCHENDLNGMPLTTTPTALGWESAYSVFECVYSKLEDHKLNQHKCSYYKNTGNQAIGYFDDGCPTKAVECSSVDTPKFSAQGKYETPPWIERERYLAYLMGHPAGS
jgi:hypothetical protein